MREGEVERGAEGKRRERWKEREWEERRVEERTEESCTNTSGLSNLPVLHEELTQAGKAIKAGPLINFTKK